MAATLTPLVPFAASQPGALSGFGCTCERCGLVIRSSMETIARDDASRHVAWHVKQDAAAAKFAAKVARARA